MEGLGKKLQEARLARNLTLDEAGRMTKIRPGRLQEIENEDFSEFASLAYAKGFLLIYGKFLDVDVSPYLEAFETSESVTVDGYSYLQDNPAPKPSRTVVVRNRGGGGGRSSFMPFVIGVIVLVVGFVGMKWILEVQRLKPNSHPVIGTSPTAATPTDKIIAPHALPVENAASPTPAIAAIPTPQPTVAAPSPIPQPSGAEPEVRRAEPVNPQELPKTKPSPAPTVRRILRSPAPGPVQTRPGPVLTPHPAALAFQIAPPATSPSAHVEAQLPDKPKIGMISLGCAKNLVDAEIMLGSVLEHGMEITSLAEEADVLVVNTCAFIDSAKEESIDAILEAHQQRGLGKKPGQKLIVSGCMSQRFSRELRESLPEVDAFVGLDQVGEMGAIVRRVLRADSLPGSSFVTDRPTYIPNYDTPRFRLTPAHSVYLKIAEGCNHPCSFCVIPQMRGRHRSRPPASVLSEIRALVAEGVREISLISQDTTYYGMDLWTAKAGPRQPVDSSRGPTLTALLREIQNIDGDFWVRLLYTHPAHWSAELIETIAQCDKVARYIDMPLQHIDEAMLGRMRRETSRAHIEDLIGALRAGIPGVALRTTFIVGFPGESDEAFESLLEFIERTRFERLGVFKYSQEEGSRAAKMPEQLPVKIKNERYRRAMTVQQRIAREMAAEKIGRELRLLVDQPLVARTEADAPEVDARVILSQPAAVGEFTTRRITGSRGYDLLA